MCDQPKTPLEKLAALCRELGAEVRYHPEQQYFTAMLWDGWGPPFSERAALAVQQQIQKQAAQYPGTVCYCFDPFSTLVYVV